MERFDSIYIMLGFECNFNCVYCLQGDLDKAVVMPALSDRLLRYLDEYPYKKDTRLLFWGGEPLIYYDMMKRFIKRYAGQYRFSVISNGSLLTADKVKFFNKHKVHFILSHDAHITKETRGRDMWQEIAFRECFEKLDSRTINVTVTAKSPSYEDIFAYYPQDEDVNINPLINTQDNEYSRRLANFALEDIERDLKYLIAGYEAGRENETRNLRKLLMAVLRFIEVGDKNDRCFDCVYGTKTLNVDTQGNVYFCHNSMETVGTVEDDYEKIAARTRAIVSKVRKGCEGCKVDAVCGGSCYLLSGYGREQQCERLRTVYGVLLPYLSRKGEELYD